MRCHLFVLACLITGGCAASQASVNRFHATFGMTEYLPLHPTHEKASDYVPDGRRAVSEAIRSCGGRSISYVAMTDGAAGFDFNATKSLAQTQACIAQSLPQVSICPIT